MALHFTIALSCWGILMMSWVAQAQVANPGAKVRVTQAGLDYVNEVAIDLLMTELNSLEIPDVNESTGPIDVSIKNIEVLSFTRPVSRIETVPGFGLRWVANNVNPHIRAEYSAQVKFGFIKVKKEGSVSVRGKGMSFDVKVYIGRDYDSLPSVSINDCEASGDISLYFSGGASDILNMAASLFKKKIRSLIMAQICFQATKEVNDQMEKVVSKMPGSQHLFDYFLLDYHLTQFPEFHEDYLEASLRAGIWHTHNDKRPTFQPPPIPSYEGHVTKMVYAYVTNYVINSGLQEAYDMEMLRFTFDKDTKLPFEVPEDVFQYLYTSCPASLCLGSLIPQIEAQYPNSGIEVKSYATIPPWVDIIEGQIEANIYTQTDLLAVQDSSRNFLFSVHLNISTAVGVALADNKVYFNITTLIPSLKTDGELAEINGMDFFFGTMARIAMQQFVLPKLNEIGAAGFDLPDMKELTLINPEILHSVSTGDVLVIGTDLRLNITGGIL